MPKVKIQKKNGIYLNLNTDERIKLNEISGKLKAKPTATMRYLINREYSIQEKNIIPKDIHIRTRDIDDKILFTTLSNLLINTAYSKVLSEKIARFVLPKDKLDEFITEADKEVDELLKPFDQEIEKIYKGEN